MYIKLYEQWLNEDSPADILAKEILSMKDSTRNQIKKGTKNFTMTVRKRMDTNNRELDDLLNKFSQYGNFSAQIREAVKENKAKYSDSLWSNLGTISGVENAINTFKMMFSQAFKDKNINTYRSKFEDAMDTALASSGYYKFDDEIMNSSKIMELMGAISNGNKKYANEIGFYFAMFDVACAVTNGLYFISGQLPITMKYPLEDGTTFKNLKELANYSGPLSFKDLVDNGISQFQLSYTTSTPSYFTAGSSGHGRTIAYGVKKTEYFTQLEKFNDYVNNFSLANIQKEAQSNVDDYQLRSVFPAYAFGIASIGNYYNNVSKSIIERSITFMEQGGGTWYQKLIGR